MKVILPPVIFALNTAIVYTSAQGKPIWLAVLKLLHCF